MTHNLMGFPAEETAMTEEEEAEVAQILVEFSQKVLEEHESNSFSKNKNNKRGRSASEFTLVNWTVKRRRTVPSPSAVAAASHRPSSEIKNSSDFPKEQALGDYNRSSVNETRELNVAKQCSGLEKCKEVELSAELSLLFRKRRVLAKATDAFRFFAHISAHFHQLKQRETEVESELIVVMENSRSGSVHGMAA